MSPLDPEAVFARMERMYRPQRAIYDLTRRFYLLGRDRLVDGVPARPGDRVLEIGCGTGRNLLRLGRRVPDLLLCGVDPAASMLAFARRRLERANLGGRVRLVHGVAERIEPERDFGVAAFDHVIASFCLSMIPEPLTALERALSVLAPGGTLHVVDFGSMSGWPSPLAAALRAWLALFGVHHRPELRAELRRRAAHGEGRLEEREIAGAYAELARFSRPRATSSARPVAWTPSAAAC